jgi:hypothetical protein
MKQILDNTKEINKNTKLNLPSTWTKKKMASLFLMSLLSVNRVKAGQAFKNCLTYWNSNAYNSLLNYPFSSDNAINSGQWLNLCCTNFQCSPITSNGGCLSGDLSHFSCVKLTQSIFFCDSNNSLCLGIVGNSQINTNNSLGNWNNCSKDSITELDKGLTNFSLVGIQQGYAKCEYSLPSNGGLQCSWDNGGWTCHSYANANVYGSHDISSNCYLQWPAPWPGPVDKYPSASVIASPTSITSSSASPATSPIVADSYLTKKIAIPVGTVVGVITIGGVTYLVYKKSKNNNPHLLEHAIETLPNPVAEMEELPSQLERDRFQAQIQTPPK